MPGGALRLGALDDRFGQRMLGPAFQRCGQRQKVRLGHIAQRHRVGQLRLAHRQRAGLVDDQRIDSRHAFQRLGVLDQHARLRAASRRRGDRDRRGQPERAGARDDQHRHGRGDGKDQRRFGPEDHPHDEGKDRSPHDRRHKYG